MQAHADIAGACAHGCAKCAVLMTQEQEKGVGTVINDVALYC